MSKRKKLEAVELFERGTDFFNSISKTISMAKELFTTFKDIKAKNESSRRPDYNCEVNDEEKVKKSSYRFMKLEPGCGIESVRNRFRQMVKERRPDLKEDIDKTKWFTALQVARETLLKYEK